MHSNKMGLRTSQTLILLKCNSNKADRGESMKFETSLNPPGIYRVLLGL